LVRGRTSENITEEEGKNKDKNAGQGRNISEKKEAIGQ
jgi:hypothetical protein